MDSGVQETTSIKRRKYGSGSGHIAESWSQLHIISHFLLTASSSTMKNFYILNLAIGTLFLVTIAQSVSINFRNYTTAAVTASPSVDRTRLQQQQLVQQQLQAVAAAAAAAAQQKQQQQQQQQQAQSPQEVQSPAPVAPVQVQPPKQPQVVNPPTSTDIEQPSNEVSKWCQLHVYKKSRVTWLEAYRTCRNIGNGTELATVKSEEEYAMLNSKVKEAGSPASVIYWTAGTDLIDEGEFFWMTDGTSVKNAQWAQDQPDNHWESEHCIALKRYPHEANYKMTDENCLMAGAFICTQPCKFWV